VALVIGGTSGIGKAIADGCAAAGARVLVAGRTPAKLPSAGGYLADVNDAAQLKKLVDSVIADHGRIDVLVNSQGVLTLRPAEEFTAKDWDDIIGTNLKSVFFACTEVGRHMLARGSGVIINIASLASYRGWRGSALYAVSKAGVVNLTETLATEWAGRGVRVNAIAPGFFIGEQNRALLLDETGELTARGAQIVAATPAGRLGEPDELAGTVIWLCSAAASFVTGVVVPVDGGFDAFGGV
jgi:NAD(P)-dependent dehydrogenase (short-subunit alcohol dehydrogenase family)